MTSSVVSTTPGTDPAGQRDAYHSGCSGAVPSCAVNPGDRVTVDISNTGGNNWDISLTDAGNWTWSTTLTYASSESSAEWIQEAPSLGGVQTIPAAVGTVSFTGSTYTAGGSTGTIARAARHSSTSPPSAW